MSESVEVRLTGHNSDLNHKIEQSREKLSEFKNDVTKIAGAIGVAFAIGKIHEFTSEVFETIGAQVDLAARLNATQGEVASLQRGAELAGISFGQFQGALDFLNKTLGKAITTGAGATETLHKLGLSAKELSEMPADKRVAEIMAALEKVENPAQKATMAMELFGRGAAKLLNLDTATLERARKETEAFGLSLSKIDASNAEALGDNFGSLEAAAKGLVTQFEARLSPVLLDLTDRWLEHLVATNNNKDSIESFGASAMRALYATADAARFLVIGVEELAIASNGLVELWGKANETLASFHKFGAEFRGDSEAIIKFTKEEDEAREGVNKAIERNIALAKSLEDTKGADYGKELKEYLDFIDRKVAAQKEAEKKAKAEPKTDGGGSKADAKDGAKDTAAMAAFEDSLLSRKGKADKAYAEELDTLQKYYTKAGVLTKKGEDLLIKSQAKYFDTIDKMQKEADKKTDTKKKEEAAAAAKIIAMKKHQEAEVAQFMKGFDTKREAANKAYAKDLKQLITFHDKKRITEIQYTATREQLERRHQDELTAIEKSGMSEREKFEAMSLGAKMSMVFGSLSSMTAGVSQHNKTMFEINKASAMASAAVELPSAVMKAYASAGPPINFALAATTAAAGLAQIQAIRSSTFNGGGAGSAPSIAGTTPAPPVTNVGSGGGGQTSNRSLSIDINGLDPNAMFSGSQIRGLMSKITSEMKDGATLGGLTFQ